MMNKDRLGNAIATRILTFAGYGLVGGDESRLRELCKAIADEIIKEIDVNATLKIPAMSFSVLPGTFVENNPVPNTPITGLGLNDTIDLTGVLE